MSNDDTNPRARRSSVTQAALANLFQRSNSTSSGTPAFPSAITSAAMSDQRRRLSVTTLGLSGTSPTGAGASGGGNGGNANPLSAIRRASMSTNGSGADSVDENAIEEEDSPPGAGRGSGGTVPTTPFTRRMSFGAQAMRSVRGGGASPGNTGRHDPSSVVGGARRGSTAAATRAPQRHNPQSPSKSSFSSAFHVRTRSDASPLSSPLSARNAADQGFNWSEQLRSRAESISAGGPGARPGSFSFGSSAAAATGSSPPRGGWGSGGSTTGQGGPFGSATGGAAAAGQRDRNKSVSDMPAPPAAAAQARATKPDTRAPPDHFQERILKGDFYMD